MLSAAVPHEAAPVRRLAQVISMAPCCGLPCRSHVDAAPEALAQYLPPLSSRGRPRPQGRHSKRAGGDPRGSPGPAADAGRAPHPPVLPAFGTPEGAHRPSLKGFRQLQLLLDLIAPFFGHPIISRHIRPSPAHPADIPRRCRSACSTHLREGVCLPTRPLGTFVLKGARRPSHASTQTIFGSALKRRLVLAASAKAALRARELLCAPCLPPSLECILLDPARRRSPYSLKAAARPPSAEVIVLLSSPCSTSFLHR